MAGKSYGMDTDAMARTVKFIGTQLQELEQLIRSLDGAVNGVDWTGDDAQEFKTQGWHDAKSKLNKAHQTLCSARDVLQRNLNDQIKTSSRY